MSALGTEVKINIHAEPIDGLHMEDYDFEAEFYVYTNKSIIINKEDLIKIDADNYVALVDSTLLGAGTIYAKIVAEIPDDDFDDAHRTEVFRGSTGITITK